MREGIGEREKKKKGEGGGARKIKMNQIGGLLSW